MIFCEEEVPPPKRNPPTELITSLTAPPSRNWSIANAARPIPVAPIDEYIAPLIAAVVAPPKRPPASTPPIPNPATPARPPISPISS